MVLMKLTNDNLTSVDATFDDTLGIVDHGIEIKGVDIAVLIIKKEDESFYVSLRGKNNINVANVAIAMGGGGHEHVAAFQHNGTYNSMYDTLMDACQKELEQHPAENDIANLFSGSDDDEINE
jgi:phosphoesterase RecJ-like protein